MLNVVKLYQHSGWTVSHQHCIQLCATFSTSSHQIHKAENGSAVRYLSLQPVLQSSSAYGWTQHTKPSCLIRGWRGVIVSNFIQRCLLWIDTYAARTVHAGMPKACVRSGFYCFAPRVRVTLFARVCKSVPPKQMQSIHTIHDIHCLKMMAGSLSCGPWSMY